MIPLFVDTNVLLYAVGGPHPRRDSCAELLVAARDGDVRLHCSAELVQEFLFHRLRRDPASVAVAKARAVRDLCVVHPVDDDVVEGMLQLAESGGIGGRDALHAATALARGFTSIVTCDADFATVAGLATLAPDEVLGIG